MAAVVACRQVLVLCREQTISLPYLCIFGVLLEVPLRIELGSLEELLPACSAQCQGGAVSACNQDRSWTHVETIRTFLPRPRTYLRCTDTSGAAAELEWD